MGMVCQCDVCGKIVKNETCIELTMAGVNNNDTLYIGHPYYLCDHCTEKLKNWISRGGKLDE